MQNTKEECSDLNVTGNHAEKINAISKTTKSLMECLPKSCQDMLH